ncbi:MAG: phage tail assembly chaperone [Pseudomonas palmensis]|uniref:phage tail assembly chaperone n=1 Tax=Pseudomonas palmensis TaxID=2815362 RepID=UPI003D103B6B
MKYALFDESGALLARYDSAVHGAMPASGYVELSEELFQQSIAETDGMWMLGADGIITKRPRLLTSDQVAFSERAWRDVEVSGTEWLVTRHRDEQDMQLATTFQAEQFAELLLYRQALRDWPQSELFPGIEHRPVPPSWLESMTP